MEGRWLGAERPLSPDDAAIEQRCKPLLYPEHTMPATSRKKKPAAAAVAASDTRASGAVGGATRARSTPAAAAPARTIGKRDGPDNVQQLTALFGSSSLSDRQRGTPFWTPSLIGYFERVATIKADADALFVQIGTLAGLQTRMVGGAENPAAAMASIGHADAGCAAQLAVTEAQRAQLAGSTAARLAELDGNAASVEMRIRSNIDGSLERKLALCGETLDEARQQYAAEMASDGWKPPTDPSSSSCWTYEPDPS